MKFRDRYSFVLALGLAVTGLAAVIAQTALSRLNVPESDARQYLVDSITTGYPSRSLAMTRAFLALPPVARAEVVTAALAWAKTVTMSPAFTAIYLKRREQTKPTPPQFEGSVDDALKKMNAEQRKSLEEMKKSIPTMPAEMRPTMEATLKQMTQMIESQEKDPKFQQMMRQGLEMQRTGELQEYKEALAAWETRYPPDPKPLMIAGLKKFLALPADVDFTAKVVKVAGMLKFENPEYEAKPADWKLVYRAGKEAMTAARRSAQAWLAELETPR